MDLDYITQEKEREKKEKENLIEDWETRKGQFKMNIIKGKKEELKAETENFCDVLRKEIKEETKHQ